MLIRLSVINFQLMKMEKSKNLFLLILVVLITKKRTPEAFQILEDSNIVIRCSDTERSIIFIKYHATFEKWIKFLDTAWREVQEKQIILMIQKSLNISMNRIVNHKQVCALRTAVIIIQVFLGKGKRDLSRLIVNQNNFIRRFKS